MLSTGTIWARWPASASGRCPTSCRRRTSSSGALDTVKVTLALSRASVDFFRDKARRQRVPYQRMIRALVGGATDR